jgi:hypothetical protein
MDQTVEVLVAKGRIKAEVVALDSTFIEAYSRRNLDNDTSSSDPRAKDWESSQNRTHA